MFKNNQKKLIYFLLIIGLISFSFQACETSKIDPCDSTVKSEKAVSLQITAHILTLNNEPVAGKDIEIMAYKTPCGEDSKGRFTFNGVTSNEGTFSSTTLGYNLRNSKDEVYVRALAINLENYFEQNFSTEIYKYDDFSNLSTKYVHLYIYTQDQE
ncbi:MAG: hypothetical protein K9G76_06595 [Bacteroidales bacterium]|nr:hypothetical protein [Bacteroidales bacterium]MCF8402301.1 hypothetical protein [Bacteroidales bacterium]